MLAEEELIQQSGVQQAVDWLRNEASARQIVMEICSDQIEERRSEYYTRIMVPVELPTLETGDFLEMLGTLQNKWNNQEPRPSNRLSLYPAGLPPHAV